MVDQPVKEQYLTRNVLLGWIAIGLMAAVAIIGFRFIETQNSLASTPEQIPRITVDELKRKMNARSNVAVVDVRSKEEYEASHITGAISMPSLEISQRYQELKGYRQIVTYCT